MHTLGFKVSLAWDASYLKLKSLGNSARAVRESRSGRHRDGKSQVRAGCHKTNTASARKPG